MKKVKVFIACDTSSPKIISKIIKKTSNKKINLGFKIGLQFFLSPKGRSFILKIKKKTIFLDLKLNDIPNTCSSAIYSLKDLKNISYLTVHINGGLEMLKAAKKAAKKINKKLKILGVTVLTSFSNRSIKQVGYTKNLKDLVKKQAALAKIAKLDGVICSPHEIKYLRKICKNMEIITPGIRLPGDKKQDQVRVMSPKQAFDNGATSIVMGRSITKGNIKSNMKKLIHLLS